jgi:hypothetical protein
MAGGTRGRSARPAPRSAGTPGSGTRPSPCRPVSNTPSGGWGPGRAARTICTPAPAAAAAPRPHSAPRRPRPRRRPQPPPPKPIAAPPRTVPLTPPRRPEALPTRTRQPRGQGAESALPPPALPEQAPAAVRTPPLPAMHHLKAPVASQALAGPHRCRHGHRVDGVPVGLPATRTPARPRHWFVQFSAPGTRPAAQVVLVVHGHCPPGSVETLRPLRNRTLVPGLTAKVSAAAPGAIALLLRRPRNPFRLPGH